MKRPKTSNCRVVHSGARHCCERAAAIIKAGGIVGIPTETSYGLAVDPFNSTALQKLFAVKRRSVEKPVLVLVDSQPMLRGLVTTIPALYQPLCETYWPGPLTLVFPARSGLPSLVRGGTNTIGIRISSNRIASTICTILGGPITATSANPSGRPAASDSVELVEMFGRAIDLIVDDGRIEPGLSSTIVAVKAGRLDLIRAGRIDFETMMK